jgi:DNA-binding transcriptional regulator YhcF (GntR family)
MRLWLWRGHRRHRLQNRSMLTTRDNSGTLVQPIDQAVRRAILAGQHAPGARRPARRTLVHALNLSRHPVLRAYDQCPSEGSIIRQAGLGTSVAAARSDVTRSAPEAMDMTDEGAGGQVFAGCTHVDHGRISAGTTLNSVIVNNDLAILRRIVDERLWGLTSVVWHADPGLPC